MPQSPPIPSARPPAQERRLIASLASYESWAQTVDRTARTANARAALEQKFLDAADGDPARAAALRKAHYLRLALKSAQARRRRREAAAAPPPADPRPPDEIQPAPGDPGGPDAG